MNWLDYDGRWVKVNITLWYWPWPITGRSNIWVVAVCGGIRIDTWASKCIIQILTEIQYFMHFKDDTLVDYFPYSCAFFIYRDLRLIQHYANTSVISVLSCHYHCLVFRLGAAVNVVSPVFYKPSDRLSPYTLHHHTPSNRRVWGRFHLVQWCL